MKPGLTETSKGVTFPVHWEGLGELDQGVFRYRWQRLGENQKIKMDSNFEVESGVGVAKVSARVAAIGRELGGVGMMGEGGYERLRFGGKCPRGKRGWLGDWDGLVKLGGSRVFTETCRLKITSMS